GAPRLLVVAFQVFGHIVVDHEPDVGLVDAHAKGVGGHHHLDPVEQKILLVLAAAGGVHLAVVGRGPDAQPLQHGGGLLHLADGAAIDDPRGLPLLQQELHQRPGLFALGQPPGLQPQVGPVEPRRQAERFPQAQLFLDVLADPGGGGGRKGRDHRPGGQLVGERADLPVAGPEIVPPLADAVGLVHRHHADRLLLGKAEEPLGHQPLGGHIDDLIPPLPGAAEHQGLLVRGQAAVQVGRGHPRRHQGPHLVLHQADEGADHQRHPRQQQRRHLVAHRLACAGGHHRQHVPAGQGRVHDLRLPRPEAVVPEHLLQYAVFVVHPAAASFLLQAVYHISGSGASSSRRMDFCLLSWYNGFTVYPEHPPRAFRPRFFGYAQLPCKVMQPLRPGAPRRLFPNKGVPLWNRSLSPLPCRATTRRPICATASIPCSPPARTPRSSWWTTAPPRTTPPPSATRTPPNSPTSSGSSIKRTAATARGSTRASATPPAFITRWWTATTGWTPKPWKRCWTGCACCCTAAPPPT